MHIATIYHQIAHKMTNFIKMFVLLSNNQKSLIKHENLNFKFFLISFIILVQSKYMIL